MSDSLNVIALISGGKDSLFSILHCLENGHKVVALANLYPQQNAGNGEEGAPTGVEDEAEEEDLNSFMYQTVGHSVLHLYPDCLGIPLYRRVIAGSAVQTGRYYDTSSLASAADETEDLIPLLMEVMQARPEANALCSGAILSTYQRTRVESVAARLGLTPLAYLWQYPALPPPTGRGESLTGLLDDMAAAGCDARIIKIASGGIKESLLWSNVADPRTRPRLLSGLQPFFPDSEFWLRGAVLGEGGEYETLAINGPRRLWKKRIDILEGRMSTFTGEGGVSYLRFSNARAVEDELGGSENDVEPLRIPQALDSQFQTAMASMRSQEVLMPHQRARKFNDAETGHSRRFLMSFMQVTKNLTMHHLAVSNLTAPGVSSVGKHDAAAQMKQICKYLESSLNLVSSSSESSIPLTPSSIVSTMLLLKDMSKFTAVNSIYASLFRVGEPNPPSRVTIACSLPEEVEVCLSVVCDLGPRNARRGLHVQSRSYWAPANIGPYSQAICVPLDRGDDQETNVHDAELVEMVHMAGQIPLTPQNMQLSEAEFPEQAVLSLQHLWRVGQERGVDILPWGVAFLAESLDSPFNAELACRVWQQTYLAGTRPVNATADDSEEDEDGPDAWDLQYNRAAAYETPVTQGRPGQHLQLLPNLAVFRDSSAGDDFVPPCIAAEVISMPRNCPVEWWSMGVAHLPKMPGSKPRASMTWKDHSWGTINKVTIFSSDAATEPLVHLVTVLARHEMMLASIESDLYAFLLSDEVLLAETSDSGKVVHGTAFISTQSLEYWSRIHEHRLFQDLAIVPCNSVYGWSNSEISAEIANDISSIHPKPVVKNCPTASMRERSVGAPVLMQTLAVAITMRVDA